jgi:hypothetical protein
VVVRFRNRYDFINFPLLIVTWHFHTACGAQIGFTALNSTPTNCRPYPLAAQVLGSAFNQVWSGMGTGSWSVSGLLMCTKRKHVNFYLWMFESKMMQLQILIYFEGVIFKIKSFVFVRFNKNWLSIFFCVNGIWLFYPAHTVALNKIGLWVSLTYEGKAFEWRRFSVAYFCDFSYLRGHCIMQVQFWEENHKFYLNFWTKTKLSEQILLATSFLPSNQFVEWFGRCNTSRNEGKLTLPPIMRSFYRSGMTLL